MMNREELVARVNASHTAGDPTREAVLALVQENADLAVKVSDLQARLMTVEAADSEQIVKLNHALEAAESRTAALAAALEKKPDSEIAAQCRAAIMTMETKLAEAERYGKTEDERWAKLVAALAAAESREKALEAENKALREALDEIRQRGCARDGEIARAALAAGREGP